MNNIYGKFYSPEHALSYGRPYVFSVGSRSIGKSTGWAIHLIDQFVKYKRQWIYTRRDEKETMKTCEHFFDTAISIYNNYHDESHTLEYKSGAYYIDGEVSGFVIPLSQQQKYKSGNYSGVWFIIYDEFMIAPGSNARYLGGRGRMSSEVDAMSSLYQSVDRGEGRAFRNETTVAFLGNAGTFYNPFFISYGIDKYLRPDTKYLAPKGELYVVELTRETEATAEIKESYGFRLSSEKTKAYAYENSYADMHGDKSFILKRPSGNRAPVCNLIYEGTEYTVLSYEDSGFIWIGKGRSTEVPTLALTCSDHKPNYLLMANWRGSYVTNLIKQMYDFGNIRFGDGKAKLAIDFYLRYDV